MIQTFVTNSGDYVNYHEDQRDTAHPLTLAGAFRLPQSAHRIPVINKPWQSCRPN